MIDAEKEEGVAKVLLWAVSLISVSSLFAIFTYIFLRGSKVINLEFLTTAPNPIFWAGGIFPQIVGSLYLVALCTVVATPLGISAAIFLSEYAVDNFITKTTRFFILTLAGIPTIVIGLFGLTFLVYRLDFRVSLFSAGIALSFLTLPWTITVSEESMRAVPMEYREAALALGATKWQTTWHVVFKAAAPGIITGILLGIGKALGETTIPLMCGGSGLETFVPRSLFEPVGGLPVYTFIFATQGNVSSAVDRAFGGSLVLTLMFLVISASALVVRNRYRKN